MTLRILVGCAIALLSGCVSQKTALTNSAGQSTRCDAWGFGIIGAPVAMASHADCVKKAHAAGYSENPQPPVAASAP